MWRVTYREYGELVHVDLLSEDAARSLVVMKAQYDHIKARYRKIRPY